MVIFLTWIAEKNMGQRLLSLVLPLIWCATGFPWFPLDQEQNKSTQHVVFGLSLTLSLLHCIIPEETCSVYAYCSKMCRNDHGPQVNLPEYVLPHFRAHFTLWIRLSTASSLSPLPIQIWLILKGLAQRPIFPWSFLIPKPETDHSCL